MGINFTNDLLLISDLIENLNYFKSIHGDVEIEFFTDDSEVELEIDQICEGFNKCGLDKIIKVCEIRLEEVAENN